MGNNITIIDVAKAAGVSIATVSRVINDNAKVDEALAARVRRTIGELKYTPNPHARSMKRARENSIGIIIPSAHDNFFSHILEGVLQAAEYYNLRVIVYSCHGSSSFEENCLKSASTANICGLLYCPSSDTNAMLLADIFPADFPLVILYRRDFAPGVPHIYHDNIKGGYLATKYLLKQGHKEIAFFAGFWQDRFRDAKSMIDFMRDPKRGCYSSLDRLDGYMKALDEQGIPFDESLIFSIGYDFASGYERTKDFLSSLRDFDSIICCNDSAAAGVLQTLREENISVPQQVSLIGYDDSVFATIARPQLTSVRQEPDLLGYGSVEMLVNIIHGDIVADRVVDVRLIIRNSTFNKNT